MSTCREGFYRLKAAGTGVGATCGVSTGARARPLSAKPKEGDVSLTGAGDGLVEFSAPRRVSICLIIAWDLAVRDSSVELWVRAVGAGVAIDAETGGGAVEASETDGAATEERLTVDGFI